MLLATLGPAIATTATGLAATSSNHLDRDTQDIESGTGHWVPWYSTTIARSTAKAKSGTGSLRVDITAPYGWGVSLDNWPGFGATAGAKRISWWGLAGSGNGIGASLRVLWRDGAGRAIQTDVVTVTSLTTTWQEAAADVTAPVGTVSVWLELHQSSGRPGDHFFVDDVIVGDRASASEESAAPPSVSTPPSHAPLAPPEQVCDSAALDGPTTRPPGSVRVDPGEDLADATAANPPSTTFGFHLGSTSSTAPPSGARSSPRTATAISGLGGLCSTAGRSIGTPSLSGPPTSRSST